jgi:hypothetical protein
VIGHPGAWSSHPPLAARGHLWLTSTAVVSKPTKRPTKRKLEPTSDKVMPTRAPREAVTRISRDNAPSGASAGTAAGATASEDTEALSGTRARKAAQADKVEPVKRSLRRSRRVTEKGTTPQASGRYTPPDVRLEDLPSPLWVPVLMFTLFGLGMLTIFLNYVQIVPGGETSNWYLLLGLGFILGGIITATQYR